MTLEDKVNAKIKKITDNLSYTKDEKRNLIQYETKKYLNAKQ